jgi:hypothetical protein
MRWNEFSPAAVGASLGDSSKRVDGDGRSGEEEADSEVSGDDWLQLEDDCHVNEGENGFAEALGYRIDEAIERPGINQ